jgi:hypothetical protein
VILGVYPEHRDGRHPIFLRHPFGEPDGRDRLEQREQRSAKQACLLACHDRDSRSIAQLRRRG